ncbi:MAG: hypothetical protein II938_00445 [Alphaproteobacteria bacterium]|nr:hypothetical protein [Alphaproteobacteria bacterium]
MNKTLKVMGQLAIMAGLCFAGAAFAAGNATDLFGTAATKLGTVFQNVRVIVFILGGFALVGFAVAAIFGKFEWKKVAILAVGLALLAVASQVVQYAINEESGSGPSYGISDTLGQNEGSWN